jgi:hypothetical protein
VTRYPSVEEIIKYHTPIYLGDSCHSVFTVTVANTDLFYKPAYSQALKSKFAKKLKGTLRKIDVPIRKFFSDKSAFLNYRDMDADLTAHDYTLDIESTILEEWNKRGISCIQILERQNNALVYKKMNALHYGKLLLSKTYPNPEYDQLLNVITTIRSAAKSENNPMLLHPDLTPRNFLYCFDTNKAIAIDPGQRLKEGSVEELDAKLNLHFLHSLAGLNDDKKYISAFVDTLDSDEKKLMLHFNQPLSWDVEVYFGVRTNLLSLYRTRKLSDRSWMFSKNNTKLITRILFGKI